MSDDTNGSGDKPKVAQLFPFDGHDPYSLPDPKLKKIIIWTEYGEDPILFKICSIGAHLGYFVAYALLWISWLSFSIGSIVYLSENIGSYYIGVPAAIGLWMLLYKTYLWLRYREASLSSMFERMSFKNMRRTVHKLCCNLGWHRWGHYSDGDFCYWCGKRRDED